MIGLIDYINKNKYSEFISLCCMDKNDLKNYLYNRLKVLGYNDIFRNMQDNTGYIYAKGDVKVVLIAHLDTVFDEGVSKNISIKNNIISCKEGLGADDRLGVYIILKIIEKYKCSVLFVDDEEYGQHGSKAFIRSPYFDDFKAYNNSLLSFDLSGGNDIKFYNTTNKAYIERIKNITKYNVKDSSNKICDLVILSSGYTNEKLKNTFEGSNLCGVNISCGYYNEHSFDEYANMEECDKTIKTALKIISAIKNKKYYNAIS